MGFGWVDELWPILEEDLPNTAGKHRKDFLELPCHNQFIAAVSRCTLWLQLSADNFHINHPHSVLFVLCNAPYRTRDVKLRDGCERTKKPQNKQRQSEWDLFYLPSSPVFLPQWRQNVSPLLTLRWGRCTLGLWPGWIDGCDLMRRRRNDSQDKICS